MNQTSSEIRIRAKVLLGLIPILMLAAFLFLTDIWYLRSGSMAPEYPTGSLIITTRLIKPKIGLVCAYRHNDITIVHRIISENADGFILKGDANNVADPMSVPADEIEGVMLFGLRPLE